MAVVGLALVPRNTSYVLAPETAFQLSVTCVAVTKLPLAGPAATAQPGAGFGPGPGVGVSFFPQETQ